MVRAKGMLAKAVLHELGERATATNMRRHACNRRCGEQPSLDKGDAAKGNSHTQNIMQEKQL